jgi:hypothetical protein
MGKKASTETSTETQEATTAVDPNDVSNSAYDEAARLADVDERLGNQDWYITDVSSEAWPSGDPYLKVKGTLLGHGTAIADLTLSPLPPPEEMANLKTWEQGKQFQVKRNIKIRRQFKELYGITDPENQLAPGQIYAIKTEKVKGFIRVKELRAKSQISSSGVATAAVPF